MEDGKRASHSKRTFGPKRGLGGCAGSEVVSPIAMIRLLQTLSYSPSYLFHKKHCPGTVSDMVEGVLVISSCPNSSLLLTRDQTLAQLDSLQGALH